MATDRSPLADDDELLFRQVHPSFLRDGRPSSQAFRPTTKDEGKLSVARGSLTTPSSAFHLYTEGLGLPSAGTWGVTVAECREQGLPAFSDPLTAPLEKAPIRRMPSSTSRRIRAARRRRRGRASRGRRSNADGCTRPPNKAQTLVGPLAPRAGRTKHGRPPPSLNRALSRPRVRQSAPAKAKETRTPRHDEPDALVDEPDALVDETDALVDEPDALVDEPDALVDETDALVDEPDALVDEPDALVDEPDARPDETDARLDVIDARLDVIDARLDVIDARLLCAQATPASGVRASGTRGPRSLSLRASPGEHEVSTRRR